MKTFFSLKRIATGVGGLLLASFVLTSCLKDKNDGIDNNLPAAGLMAFNLAPDKTINVGLSGSAFTQSPLAYTSYTGSYYRVNPGSRAYESYDANNGSVIDRTTFNFADSQYYSGFLIGRNGTYRNVIAHDNFDNLTATPGKAFVRFIYAIPDSATSVVTFNSSGSDVVNQPAKFGSLSAFTEVPAGSISVTVSGGVSININRSITFEERKVYTVLIIGIPESTNEPDKLQIRYVTHGTIDEEPAARASSARAQSAN